MAKGDHKLRKFANGATVAQLKALFGWTDDAMPALYTKTAESRTAGARTS